MTDDLERLRQLSGMGPKKTSILMERAMTEAPKKAAAPSADDNRQYYRDPGDGRPVVALGNKAQAGAGLYGDEQGRTDKMPGDNTRFFSTPGSQAAAPKAAPAAGGEGNFKDAFAAARAAQGPNGTFTWNSKQYSTNRADDKPAAKPNPVPPAGSSMPAQPSTIGASTGPDSRFGAPSVGLPQGSAPGTIGKTPGSPTGMPPLSAPKAAEPAAPLTGISSPSGEAPGTIGKGRFGAPSVGLPQGSGPGTIGRSPGSPSSMPPLSSTPSPKPPESTTDTPDGPAAKMTNPPTTGPSAARPSVEPDAFPSTSGGAKLPDMVNRGKPDLQKNFDTYTSNKSTQDRISSSPFNTSGPSSTPKTMTMPSAAGGPAKNQSFSTVSPGAGNVSKSYTPGAYDDEDNIAESIADLRRLSGLAECGCDDAPMEKQAGKVNVNTTMSTDGTRNINISADGEAADALMQMLKLAGLAGHHDEETVVAIPEGKKPDYLDFDKDGDKKEPMKKALRDKAKVKEEIADEGNEFSGALAKAKAAHKDEFEVGGKTYKVKESAKPDYLDFDRDGNKKEPMKKALRDKKK